MTTNKQSSLFYKSKRRLVQTKVYFKFLICPNLNDSQTFKGRSFNKTFLQCVFYRCNAICFNKCFLFHVITGYVIFSKSLSLLWNFFSRYIVIFFETSVLKEVLILRLSSKIKLSYTILIHILDRT